MQHGNSSIQQEDPFHQQNGLKFKEETSDMLLLSTDLYGAEIWTLPKNASEIPGKFRDVVLGKDGRYQLDPTYEK